jgi:hypothetical protein
MPRWETFKFMSQIKTKYIADNQVTNAKLAQVSSQTIKGRTTAGTGNSEDLTATQATAILNAMVGDSGSGGTKGLVPAPGSGDAANGKFLKADGTFAIPSGTSGVPNYIINPNAEFDTTGWATYADAAGSSPVDGTGGTATGLTFSRSTSSPLRGTGSFSLVQSNSTNIQGKGVSYDFTIDSADQAKVLAIQFDYNASSTFIPSSGASGSASDLQVFIYDVTNAVLIPVNPNVITASGSNNFAFKGTFQTASNSTSYRLILHVATTSANATGWTFKFDAVSVGPQVGGSASVKAPTVQSFLSGSGTYTTPTNPAPLYIEVEVVGGGAGGSGAGSGGGNGGAGNQSTFGSSLLTATGASSGSQGNAGSGGSVTINSPAIELTKTPGATGSVATQTAVAWAAGANGANTPLGGAGMGFSGAVGQNAIANTGSGGGGGSMSGTSGIAGSGGGAGAYLKAIIFNPAASYSYVVGGGGGSGTAGTGGNAGGTGGSGRVVVREYYAPVSPSLEGDGRVCAALLTGTPPTTSGASAFIFPTVSFDTHGAYNATTGRYTAPVSGIYKVSGSIGTTNAIAIDIYVNGVFTTRVLITAASVGAQVAYTGSVKVNAGDLIDLRSNATSGTNNGNSTMYIERLSGPASVGATESVGARYFNSSTSISGTPATIVWTTKDYDTHNAMSSGVYTIPVSGRYQVNAVLSIAATFSLNQNIDITIQKNGVTVSEFVARSGGAMTAINGACPDVINCLAGDTIRVQVSTAASSPSINSSNTQNFFSIAKVG